MRCTGKVRAEDLDQTEHDPELNPEITVIVEGG